MKRLELAYHNNHKEGIISMTIFKPGFINKAKSKVHHSQYIRTEITSLVHVPEPFKFLTSKQVERLMAGI